MQCATSAVIVPLGDLSAQAIEQAKARKAVLAAGGDPETDLDGIDWVRVLRFMVFGATLQPIWNHYYFQVIIREMTECSDLIDAYRRHIGMADATLPLFMATFFIILSVLPLHNNNNNTNSGSTA